MGKTRWLALAIAFVALLGGGCSGNRVVEEPMPVPDDTPVEYYAVLAEKDSYADVNMSGLLVDYIDIRRLRITLEGMGWPADHIHEVKEFTRASLEAELDWLEKVADENDIVFFYVTGHGTYLRDHIYWKSFFPGEWAEINSYRRVLVVDSCTAAEFTKVLEDDPHPQLAIAAVDDNEYGWKGLEEEGLPIVGGVFTFYFAEALQETRADANGDGLVSVQEAALAAEEKQRSYMHHVVFQVTEFVNMYHDLGVRPERDKSFPDVIMFDSIGEEVVLGVWE